jgi:hypothetical protein
VNTAISENAHPEKSPIVVPSPSDINQGMNVRDDGVAVTGVRTEQNDELSGDKIEKIGEEKSDPAFWKMPPGARIVIFDSVHSTEHVAERINYEGDEVWRLFAASGTVSSLCIDSDLSTSLVIRGSEGAIRFVRAEANSSALASPSSNTQCNSSNAPRASCWCCHAVSSSVR